MLGRGPFDDNLLVLGSGLLVKLFEHLLALARLLLFDFLHRFLPGLLGGMLGGFLRELLRGLFLGMLGREPFDDNFLGGFAGLLLVKLFKHLFALARLLLFDFLHRFLVLGGFLRGMLGGLLRGLLHGLLRGMLGREPFYDNLFGGLASHLFVKLLEHFLALARKSLLLLDFMHRFLVLG